ncbi:hypothetical protein SAMN05421743_102310 [Thalassobacillus cyri]|uniref:Uncharacterized protein n=1 Tax=Thalassobacillus cyri TaxID=571932 RepID=A0A1H3XYM2_9BACI|nr:hypothetical protein [Thalassobacillus cyri]SEA04567.1 hypothetical protein SAMN05421743_102310 [Thalassobacillus cyri]
MVKKLDFREILKPNLLLGPGVQMVKGVAYDSREISFRLYLKIQMATDISVLLSMLEQ